MKFYQALLIFISAIAGTGIFFTPIILTKTTNIVIEQIYIWFFMGILFLLYSIVFSNMIYLNPKPGSIYDYVKILNRHIGFIAGWLEYFSLVVITAFLLNLSTNTISNFIGISPYIVGILILCIFTLLILLGTKISIRALTLFGLFTMLTLFFVFFYAYFLLSNINFHKLSIKTYKVSNYLSIFLAAIFETYAGIEILGYFANRKNCKTLAKATLLGSLFIFTIYILLSFGMVLSTYYFREFYTLHFIGEKLLLLVSLQMLGTVFAWLTSIPNLLYRMSEDKNLPSLFRIKNKYDVPSISLLLTSLFIIFFYISGFFELFVKYYFISILFIYTLVSFSFLKIYNKVNKTFINKNIVKICALLSVIFSIIILWEYKREAIYLLPFLILGLSLYLAKELQRNKKLVATIHDILAPILDIFWKLTINNDIRLIEKLCGNLDKKIILDFGSSTGNLSIYLAKKYDCVVYSSDISKFSIWFLKLKTKINKIFNIVTILDVPDRIFEKFTNFFDIIIAYHTLSFIKDYDVFLDDLKRSLKKGGKFIAILYDKIFYLFECPDWIKNIERELKNRGFYCIVLKRRSFLWEKIIIYAEKLS